MKSIGANQRVAVTALERTLTAVALVLIATSLATPPWGGPSDEVRTTILALLLAALTVCALVYRYRNPQAFKSLVANMRWLRIVHYCFMLTFGALLYFHVTDTPLILSPGDVGSLAAGYAAIVLAWLSAVNINDIYDLPSDRVQRLERPLVTGAIDLATFWRITLLYLAFSAAFALLVHPKFLLFDLAGLALAYLYSAPPLRLKRSPFIATFVLASCNLLMSLMGFLSVAPDHSVARYPIHLMVMIWLIFTLANNSKDIRDYEGDKAMNVYTLPTLLGLRRSKPVIGLLMAISYLIVPPFLQLPVLYPLALVASILSYWLVTREVIRELPIFVTYFCYFLAIVAALVSNLPR